MKRQLQLVVALALFGICLLAANAAAGGISLGSGQGSVNIDLGDGSNLPSIQLPVCSNLGDDDGDGRVDLLDPGCSGPGDGDETDVAPTPEDPPVDPTVPPVIPGDDGDGDTGGNGGGDDDDFDQVPGQGGQGNGGGGKGGGKADPKPEDEVEDPDEPIQPPGDRNPDGSPTDTNPTVTVADYGAAPMGVPNFVIDQFTIPPFLLPIYQACGTQYGVPWEVLASINRIETAFGTNLNVSSAGALGWMQFIPSSWEAYGVDANNDGRKDPYNPVDAICAAANYLDAAGAQEDLYEAIFAYNHADWYVDEVLLYARQYGKIPDDLVGSLTGLTEGAHFPVAAKSRYADRISEREALERATPKQGQSGNAADVISSSPTERGINIYSRDGAPVVAVNDGVIKRIGESDKLGRYLVLEDAYGNRFTYAELGEVAEAYPVPKQRKNPMRDLFVESEEKPDEPASATQESDDTGKKASESKADKQPAIANTEDSRARLYAFPERSANEDRASLTGQLDDLLNRRMPGYDGFKSYFSSVLRYDEDKMDLAKLEEGSKVVAGTVLGRVGESKELAPHLHFEIRPTGRGAPKIDPKPILDGWKLLEATAIYRAAGKDPFADSAITTGQILLMSKEQLIKRVLVNNRLELSACDLNYVRGGQIDRRVLAAMEFLSARGYRMTITSMLCGRESSITTSGNVSNHSYGGAIDIAQINGIPVLGNQGPGSVSEALVRDTLELQGTMEPDEVISLMSFGGPSFAMGDHADHVHIGYRPTTGPAASLDKQFVQLLEPEQWERLIDQIGSIDNPTVPTNPSKYSLPAKKGNKNGNRASSAHVGE